MNKYELKLKAIESESRETLAKARAVTEKAEAEGRSLTDEERGEVDGHLKSLDVLKEQKAEVEQAIGTRQRVDDIGKTMVVEDKKGDEPSEHRRAVSIGEAFIKSDGYRRLKSEGLNGNWTSGGVDIERKALLSEDVASAGHLIQPDVQPGILPQLFQPLTIADLMASGQTTSNLVRYLKETAATNNAAIVLEGGDKSAAESALTFDSVDEPVKKIATFLPVTDEMIEDVTQLQSYINSRLALFVRTKEEAEILNGAGGNDIAGLLGRIPVGHTHLRSGVTAAQGADHIFRAISKVRESFLEPDGIVLHPADFEAIRLLKSTTENYLGSGPFAAPAAETLWGMRVVITQVMTKGTALVGAFGTAAQVYRRGGLTVEASNSHSDFFAKNKTALRAEERLALAVYRPQAFATADISDDGSSTLT